MSEFDLQPLLAELQRHGQSHVLRWWNDLSDDERAGLLEQLQLVDFVLLQELARGTSAQRDVESLAEKARRAQPPASVVRLP